MATTTYQSKISNKFEEVVTRKTLKWLGNEQLNDLNHNFLNNNNN